jgi:DNA-binding LytR/AlgR family response regulator
MAKRNHYPKSMRYQENHNDVKFFLFAIAFISAFNYYLTYNNIRFNWHLVLTYIIDTVEGWLAWWAVRTIIIYLDGKMPYGEKPLKRILVQLFMTTITGLVIIISLTELVSWIVKGKPAVESFYLFDIFIFIIWFFVINGIYIGIHYYNEWKRSEQMRIEEKKIRAVGFSVRHGKVNLLIPFSEIAGFYTEDGYTLLVNTEGKKFLPDRSLDKIEKALPREWFFRLNRQFIIHRNTIIGFKRLTDGKLDAMIKTFENLPQSIQVSRLKAADFKNWLESESLPI